MQAKKAKNVGLKLYNTTFLRLIEPDPPTRITTEFSIADWLQFSSRSTRAFENMTWLAGTHLPIAAAGFACAVLYGNEDCPAKVELYARDHYKCRPVVAEHDDRANGLVVTSWGELPKKPGKWWSERLLKGDP